MPLLEESQQHALCDISEMLVDLRQLVAAHGEFLAKFEQQTLTEEAPDSLDERSPPHQPWHTRPPDQQPIATPPRCWSLPPSVTQAPMGVKPETLPRLRLEPPRFDGENASDWIHEMQKYYNHHYTPLADRLYLTTYLFDQPASDWMASWKDNNVGEGWDEFLLAVNQRFDPDPCEDYILRQTASVDVVSDDGIDLSIALNQQPTAFAIGDPKLNEEVDDEEQLVAPDSEDVVVIAKDAGTLPLWDELPCDVRPFETLDEAVDDANAVHALIVFETKDEEFVVPTLYASWQSATIKIDKSKGFADYFLPEEVYNDDMADEDLPISVGSGQHGRVVTRRHQLKEISNDGRSIPPRERLGRNSGGHWRPLPSRATYSSSFDIAASYTWFLHIPNRLLDPYFRGFKEPVTRRPLSELRSDDEAPAIVIANSQEREGKVPTSAAEQSSKVVNAFFEAAGDGCDTRHLTIHHSLGLPKSVEVYNHAVESPGKDVKAMCLTDALLVKNLGVVDDGVLLGKFDDEKMHIARDYLERTTRDTCGIKPEQVAVTDSALLALIENYCREAGVRNLQKQIEKLYRKISLQLVRQGRNLEPANVGTQVQLGEDKVDSGSSSDESEVGAVASENTAEAEIVDSPANLEQDDTLEAEKNETIEAAKKVEKVLVDSSNLVDFVGKPVFRARRIYERTPVGVVMGLAWTAVGGSILYIETSQVEQGDGKGSLNLTGQLGDVMKESAQIAHTVARAILLEKDPENQLFSNTKIQLHVPAGATPKDGPSAGCTMITSMLSLAMNKPVKKDLAILPIGGVKERRTTMKFATLKLRSHDASLAALILSSP